MKNVLTKPTVLLSTLFVLSAAPKASAQYNPLMDRSQWGGVETAVNDFFDATRKATPGVLIGTGLLVLAAGVSAGLSKKSAPKPAK